MDRPTHVFVALLEEGTDVWRPVQARPLGSGEFELLGIVPTGETWQFPPGTLVKCKAKSLADGTVALVAYEAAGRHPDY
jgi:hypothetical protein